jgi:hypothetical protein
VKRSCGIEVDVCPLVGASSMRGEEIGPCNGVIAIYFNNGQTEHMLPV